jgi:hypothetical protein
METTSTNTKVVLPPKFNEIDREAAAAAKMETDLKFIEALREELKDWRNTGRNILLAKAHEDHWWKRYDFYGKPLDIDIPKVNTLDEVEQYADQGIPTWLIENDNKSTFGPHALFSLVHEAREFQKRELDATIAEMEAVENSRLKSVADMLKTPEIDWMVEGKIHSKGLCQIFGESYAGKTLLVLDLVMSWCAGLPEWQGYKLNNNGEPQDAVYVAAEGGAALSVHVDAWLKYHSDVKPEDLSGLLFLDGGEGDHMFLSIGKTDVDDKESWARLKQEVIAANIAPTVMVFDTQIDLAPGIEENSNTDMVGVLRKVKSLGDQLGFVAIVVHHTGHDGNKARGASGMKGKCDVQAKLTVIGDKPGKAKLEWMKVKGMALPEETISYEIMGSAKLPTLNSLGAVCVPLTKLAAGIAEHHSKTPVSPDVQRQYMLAVQDTPLSLNGLATAVGVDRNNKVFKSSVDWMLDENLLEKNPGPKNGQYYSVHPMALIPADPALDL